MILPKGVKVVPGTREALEYIHSQPRDLELDAIARTGINVADHITASLVQESCEVATLDGVPFCYHTAFVVQGAIVYAALATPVIRRFPVAWTRIAREYIRRMRETFPDLLHLTLCAPELYARPWLKVVGFTDLEPAQYLECPNGRMIWLIAK